MSAQTADQTSASVFDLARVITIVEEAIRSVVEMCELKLCAAKEGVDIDGALVVEAHYGRSAQPVYQDVFIAAQREVDRRLGDAAPDSRVRIEHHFDPEQRHLQLI